MAAARTKKAETNKKNPRILIVTPEITYLPEGMGNLAGRMSAKAGGMADVSASLVGALFDLGADVHVALPHYRRMFHEETGKLVADELRLYKSRMSSERIHLAEDRCFYYRDHVYSRGNGNAKLALAFQREVINHVIPETSTRTSSRSRRSRIPASTPPSSGATSTSSARRSTTSRAAT